MESTFGPLISAYSRADALSDRQLIDISTLSREAGFRWPVAVTAPLWHGYIKPPAHLGGQSWEGRAWDVLSLLRLAIRRAGDTSKLRFTVLFQMDDDKPLERVILTSHCGPGDDMEPVITIMLPDED